MALKLFKSSPWYLKLSQPQESNLMNRLHTSSHSNLLIWAMDSSAILTNLIFNTAWSKLHKSKLYYFCCHMQQMCTAVEPWHCGTERPEQRKKTFVQQEEESCIQGHATCWWPVLPSTCAGSQVDQCYLVLSIYSETKCNFSFKSNGPCLLNSRRGEASKERQ